MPRLGEFKGAGCDASEQPQEGGEQQDEDHGWLRGCAGALNQAHQALLNDCNQPRQQDGQDDRSLYDQVTGIGTGVSGSGEAGKALENYWRELHRYRSRSFLYRIMTLQRKAD